MDCCLSKWNSLILISSLIDIITLTVDAFAINTMIILLLLPLITVIALHGITFFIAIQFLTLSWNKRDAISLDSSKITINLTVFVHLASQLVIIDVIYAILVIFDCLGAGIMYYIVILNGINTTVANENRCNLIGIDVIAVVLLNSSCLTHILLIMIKFLAIYNVTDDCYDGYKDLSNSG